MNYTGYKNYIKEKYPEVSAKDIEFLFDSCEVIYLNYTSPYNISEGFDPSSKRATNWVARAVEQTLEKGDINVSSYSENGLSIQLDTTLINELLPYAGTV